MSEIEQSRYKKSKSLGRKIEQIERMVEYKRCPSFQPRATALGERECEGYCLSLRESRKRSSFGVGPGDGRILGFILNIC